jgi:predicted ATP-grasp superfamily ATP-dependent carboligase
MSNVRLIEIEEMNIRGAFVVNGFPSIGLVGSIVANYSSLIGLETDRGRGL